MVVDQAVLASVDELGPVIARKSVPAWLAAIGVQEGGAWLTMVSQAGAFVIVWNGPGPGVTLL
jgi:hypothetical protein